MTLRPPGPLCGDALGRGWIDQGTSCLARIAPPGPERTAASRFDDLPWPTTTQLADVPATPTRELSGPA